MHRLLENQFVNAFPELLLEAKIDALAPVIKLFLQQIERQGFTFEEFLLTLSFLAFDRKLTKAGFHLEDAAKTANQITLGSEKLPF